MCWPTASWGASTREPSWKCSGIIYLRYTRAPNRISYSLADGEWWRGTIVAVNGVGPAVCRALGAGAFSWFWKLEWALRGQFQLFMRWAVFHGCNTVFGAQIVDTFIYTGFWQVPG